MAPTNKAGASTNAGGGGMMSAQQRTNYPTNNPNQSSAPPGMINGNTNYSNFPNLHSTRGSNPVHSLHSDPNSSNPGSNDIHSIPPPSSSSSSNSSTMPLFNINLQHSNPVQNQLNLHSQNSPPHSNPSRGVNNQLPNPSSSSNSSVNNSSAGNLSMFNSANTYLSSRQTSVSNPSPSPSGTPSGSSGQFHPDFLPTPNFSDNPLLPINLGLLSLFLHTASLFPSSSLPFPSSCLHLSFLPSLE